MCWLFFKLPKLFSHRPKKVKKAKTMQHKNILACAVLGVTTLMSSFVLYRDLLFDGIVVPTALRFFCTLCNPLAWLDLFKSCENECDFSLSPRCVLRCMELSFVRQLVAASLPFDPGLCNATI